ncbi:C4-dicarboxylate ABC transporter permease [Marivivens niveibacter]|uniref:TRAP transporter small permease protein n=1 Tax=Marivivens niveibacter TaxID=1930667 RepID=A0A251WVW7_9RHOB|nr:TRAP transporter small permease subunit [Marivivens niveibacter]OUD08103.1 C4-dicarboxylate ABC transporter permease [Marivivens niveibacter]
MALLSHIMRFINGMNRLIGNVFSWLSIAIVLICFWVVVERYLFSNTRLWMQDLYPWLNGVMFTAVAAFALFHDDHVRVDIFYRPASPVKKAWMDLVGVAVFLLPFTYIVYTYCLTFVMRSWGLKEASANPGGAPGLFLVKAFIIFFAITVALQGLSMLIRSILTISGKTDLIPEDYRYKEPV